MKRSHRRPHPSPSEGAIGGHVAFSVAIVTATIAATGWLAVRLRDSIVSGDLTLSIAHGVVIAILITSIIFGGRAIQAAGRYTGATENSKEEWLKKTRARFSYQALLLVPAALIWLLSGFLSGPDATQIEERAPLSESNSPGVANPPREQPSDAVDDVQPPTDSPQSGGSPSKMTPGEQAPATGSGKAQ